MNDIRLRSNLTTNTLISFTEKSFFYTILGFSRSNSHPFHRFLKNLPGKYRSDIPINITRVDKIHLKCTFNKGSINIGIEETISFNFSLQSPPDIKYTKNLELNFLEL